MNKLNEVSMDDIENINDLSDASFDVLKMGVCSRDSEIRQRSFAKLSNFEYGYEIKNIFEKGLSDSDEIIRSDCVELLAEFDLQGNIDNLCKMLNDSSQYVVNSSVICLSELDYKNESVIKALIKKLEDSNIFNSTTLRIHYALYKLDDSYSVENLMSCYSSSRDYRDRCAILRLLIDGCREEDISTVKLRLVEIVNINDFKSVISIYNELLETL